eukprot:scaffold367680_cov47-Attheya_sp.AAC.1
MTNNKKANHSSRCLLATGIVKIAYLLLSSCPSASPTTGLLVAAKAQRLLNIAGVVVGRRRGGCSYRSLQYD